MKAGGILVLLVGIFMIGIVSGACPSGMVSYWDFDDGTAEDVFGSNDGTIYGASSVSGQVGNALIFDGVDDYVRVHDDDSLDTIGDLTIEAWIYQTGVSSDPNPQNRGSRIVDKTMAGDGSYLGFNFDTRSTDVDGDDSGRRLRFQSISGAAPSEVISDTVRPLNEWQHVAVILEGNDVTFYLNGVEDGTGVVAGSPGANNLDIYIGGPHLDGLVGQYSFFNGFIDEVAIYDRALSSAEIDEHYQKGLLESGYCECSMDQTIMKLSSATNAHGALWDDVDYSYDICYEDIFGVSGSEDRDCSNPIVWLSDVSNAHASIAEDVDYDQEVCYDDLSCRVVDESVGEYCLDGEEEVVSLIADSNSHLSDPNYRPGGLVSEWKFDGDVLDSVGGNDGVINGNPVYDDGQIGEGLVFDGDDDWVDIENFNLTEDYSYSLWVKTDVEIFDTMDSDCSSFSSVGNGVMIGWGTSFLSFGKNALAITGHWNNNVPLRLWYDFPVVKNDWTNVVITSVGDVGFVYVDGVYVGQFVDDRNFELALIGSRQYACSGTNYYFFDGSIDNVQIYNKALSQEDIQHLYNQGLYEKKVCCSAGSVLYWADANGVEITDKKPNIGDTIQAVKTMASSGTFNFWEKTYINENFLNIVVDEAVSGNLIGEWTITQKSLIDAGGTSRFAFEVDNAGEFSEEISINGTYDDSPMDVTIVSPACGNHSDKGSNIVIEVTATDEDDFINGTVSINGVVKDTFVNGGVSFSYDFSLPGNYQIVAEAVNTREKRARHISNIMIVDTSDEGSKYVAACILKPKDFSDMEESTVEFDASTTRGIEIVGGVASVVTPVASPTSFSWYWRFLPDDVVREFVKSSELKAYRFNVTFPIAGDNSANLRVEFE